jgi:hypothetical protein
MHLKSTKVKLALIPILACVLGYTMLSDTAYNPVASINNEQPKERFVGTSKKSDWPEFNLEEIALLQPFPTLNELDRIDATEGLRDSTLNAEDTSSEVGTAGALAQVRAIFQTPQGASALIGEQVYRVGDFLPNGKWIVAIRADGVEVSD